MQKLWALPAMMFVFLAEKGFADGCPPGSPAGECVSVEAPDLSEGGGTPGATIGGAIGVGGTGGVGGSASAAAINTKGQQQAADIKEKKKKEAEAQKDHEPTLLEALLELLEPEIAAAKYAMDKIVQIYQVEGSKTYSKHTIKRDPNTGVITEETHEGTCISAKIGGGEKKPGCTELRKTNWRDPSDGKYKLVITIRDFYEVPKARTTLTQKYDRVYDGAGLTFVVDRPEDVYAFFATVNG